MNDGGLCVQGMPVSALEGRIWAEWTRQHMRSSSSSIMAQHTQVTAPIS